MKRVFFLLLLLIISEINPNKDIIETKLETEDRKDSYNSIIGKSSKKMLSGSHYIRELKDLINEIDNYLISSTISDFPISSIENVNDALSYAKKIITKGFYSQNEINKIKSTINSAFEKLKLNKGKSFGKPIVNEKNL